MSSVFEIDKIDLRFYQADEIKKLAACEIKEVIAFDSLHHPVRGGLYDPRMGPFSAYTRCETCRQNEQHCPGHMGYIQLSYPAYHPLMLTNLRRFLRASCVYCEKLKLDDTQVNTEFNICVFILILLFY
jgi:DNA-directed RNA polymerase I subunit RPA1